MGRVGQLPRKRSGHDGRRRKLAPGQRKQRKWQVVPKLARAREKAASLKHRYRPQAALISAKRVQGQAANSKPIRAEQSSDVSCTTITKKDCSVDCAASRTPSAAVQSSRAAGAAVKKVVSFSSQPPVVRVVDISVDEWRSKRQALRIIVQHVEQHRKEWSVERYTTFLRDSELEATAEAEAEADCSADYTQSLRSTSLSSTSFFPGVTHLSAEPSPASYKPVTSPEGISPAVAGLPFDGVRTSPSFHQSFLGGAGPDVTYCFDNSVELIPKPNRWADTLNEEMDFSMPPTPATATSFTGFTLARIGTHASRWSDEIDTEMDFSVPPQFSVTEALGSQTTAGSNDSDHAAKSGPSSDVKTVASVECPGNSTKPSKNVMSQCGGLRHTPCRLRWADEPAVQHRPAQPVSQC